MRNTAAGGTAGEAGSAEEILLSVKDIRKYYPVTSSSLFPGRRKQVHAVDGVSFDIRRGETLGLVGESGCGKSTVGRQVVGIEQPTSGEILFEGKPLSGMKDREMRRIRTRLQMIFQDPYAALNPRKRVYDILADPMLYHHVAARSDIDARVGQLLDEVGLPKNAKDRYPHEFSGGQRQRITIARALSLEPQIIVCDEPVSALDNSIQAQILNLLKELQEDRGLTYLFIAHGLGAVHYVSRRVAVMYLGVIVEVADSEDVFRRPLHPYSRMLISAVPVPDPSIRDRKVLVPQGEVPSAIDIPQGCRFHDRCPFATDRCRSEVPVLSSYTDSAGKTHEVACFNVAAAAADAATASVAEGKEH
ncbi:MAG: ABC transporter ATP-binding protein [Lachnospiraceae bacterium]|nr:ABC transporter ATP-binding protein [Lachnospiraceae bacterium]